MLEKRVELGFVRLGRLEHEDVARIDVGERQTEHVSIRSGVSRFDQHEVAIADLPRKGLERRNEARVFDVRHDGRRRLEIVLAEEREKRGPHAGAQPPAQALAR